MIAVELVKKIVVEIDASTHEQAVALALASDASSEHQSAWDHAEAQADDRNGVLHLTPESRALTASAEFCRDVRCTAYEGGCNYWAEAQNIQRNADLEYLSYELRAFDMLGKWKLIDDLAIRSACHRILTEKLTGSGAVVQISAAFAASNPDGDAGQIDAEAADCIMQIACFGELVFG